LHHFAREETWSWREYRRYAKNGITGGMGNPPQVLEADRGIRLRPFDDENPARTGTLST
jgi:hypothetical protein